MQGGGGVTGWGRGALIGSFSLWQLAGGEGGQGEQTGSGHCGPVAAASWVARPLCPSSPCQVRPGGPEPRAAKPSPGSCCPRPHPLAGSTTLTLRLAASPTVPMHRSPPPYPGSSVPRQRTQLPEVTAGGATQPHVRGPETRTFASSRIKKRRNQ